MFISADIKVPQNIIEIWIIYFLGQEISYLVDFNVVFSNENIS